MRFRIVGTFLLLTCFLLFLGFLFAKIVNQKLSQTLLGYQPEQFTKMYIGRTEVLNALEEGIFAINTDGKIILMNESAKKMLKLETLPLLAPC